MPDKSAAARTGREEKIVFESLYLPIPDVDSYLHRIGFRGPATTDRAVLDHLIQAHLQSVPFENIDIYDRGVPIDLGTPALFKKIVSKRRGGYCFELNSLFMSLLTALGFKCYAVAGRILWKKDYYPPLLHRATIVELDGRRFFCDVAFGGPLAGRSLDMDSAGEQVTETGIFCFLPGKREIELHSRSSDGDIPFISFSDRAVDPVDFVPMNYYCVNSPESFFRSRRMAHLLTEYGRVSLEGNLLRRTGCPTVALENREEIVRALADLFGIHVKATDLQP